MRFLIYLLFVVSIVFLEHGVMVDGLDYNQVEEGPCDIPPPSPDLDWSWVIILKIIFKYFAKII